MIPRYPAYTPPGGGSVVLGPAQGAVLALLLLLAATHVSLVNAYVDTGEAKYLTRLRQLNNSFLRASRTSPGVER